MLEKKGIYLKKKSTLKLKNKERLKPKLLTLSTILLTKTSNLTLDIVN